MSAQVRAILRAQLQSLRHHFGGGPRAGAVLSSLVLAVWYALWLALAIFCGWIGATPGYEEALAPYLPKVLFGVFVYMQLGPVLLSSQGATLDLRKLLAFPVPRSRLFRIEILLRITTGLEVVCALAGLHAGLTLNPEVALKTAPAGMALFLLFNLLLGAGLKYQIERWSRHKRLREALVFLMVTAAALPQVLRWVSVPPAVRAAGNWLWGWWWPWSAAADLALGSAAPRTCIAALAWVALSWAYGRRQFERGIQRDEGPAETARPASRTDAPSRLAVIYSLPSRLLPGPLAALVEKEIRTLVRSPRFRLVFVMGFTFGVLIFLPMVMRHRSAGADTPTYQLALVCGYALLLLGDVLFWNIFGYDRSAAQFYFVQPQPLSIVLLAKNLVAAFFVALEITGVVIVWSLLRLPLGAAALAEAYAAPLVVCVYMMAAGNLASVWYPRPVSPEKATGAGSAATVRVLLLLLLPILSIPVTLAYLARFALDSDLAFWVMLCAACAGGVAFYRAAVASVAAKARERREAFLATLTAGEGPIHIE